MEFLYPGIAEERLLCRNRLREPPDEAQKAFDKVLNGIPEASYSPIVPLAQHVVSGMNYSILCMEQTPAMDGQPELYILTIYEDLDGNADIFKDTLFDHSAARVSAAASIAP
jgi:hypothetical protein